MRRTVTSSFSPATTLAPPAQRLPPLEELRLDPASRAPVPAPLQLPLELAIPDRPLTARIQLREPGVLPPEVQSELAAAVSLGGPLRDSVLDCLAEAIFSCQTKGQADVLAASLMAAALLPVRPGLDPAYARMASLIDNLQSRYPDLLLDYRAIFAHFPGLDEKRRLVFANVLLRGLRLAPVEARTVILQQLLEVATPYWRRGALPAEWDRADIILHPVFSWGWFWRGGEDMPLAENNGEWSGYCALALIFRPPAPDLIANGTLRCNLDLLLRDASQRECSLVGVLEGGIRHLHHELESLVSQGNDPRPNSILPLTRFSAAAHAWLKGDHKALPADLPRLLLYSPWRQEVLTAAMQISEDGIPGPHSAVINVLLGNVGLALLRNPDPELKVTILNSLFTIIRTSSPARSVEVMEFILQPGLALNLVQDKQVAVRLCFAGMLGAIVAMRQPDLSERASRLLEQMPQA